MPANSGIQVDSAQIRIEQERVALEDELRLSRIRLAQVEERIASITATRSRNEAGAAGIRFEVDLLVSPSTSAQPSSDLPSQSSTQQSPQPSASPTPDSPFSPSVNYQPPSSPTDPDIRTRIRAQFPDITTCLVPPLGPTPRTVSRSKQRRDRRKRLRATREVSAPDPPVVEPLPEVKNKLGIISIRRKDFKGLTHDEITYLTDCIKRHGTNVDIRNSTSIYKNTLRIFCDSKVRLQNIWESTQNITGLKDHPGFSYALPGIKFSDVTRIECRLPYDYYKKYRRHPAPLLDSFLAGCPGFDRNQVKFVRLLNTKLQSDNLGNKCIVLILDVSEGLLSYIRSKSFMTKLDKKWRVKWSLTKRDKEYKNKEYKKVENVEEYWQRKRLVSFTGARGVISSCYDFRFQL